MSTAERPQNVRILHADGTTTICELSYGGIETADDGDPIHVWRVASEFNFCKGDQLLIGMMPARTGISLPTSDLRQSS